jgi:hypothetical protein
MSVAPAGAAVRGEALRTWAQDIHRLNPTGPAAALIKIVSTAPQVALKSLHGRDPATASNPARVLRVNQ